MSARILRTVIAALLVLLPIALQAQERSVIGTGDTIKVTVLGELDQSKEVIVGDDGMISLPLAKDIQVAGLTTTEAANAIAEKLSKFIKNPDITVELTKKALKRVTVAGQIKTPGVYPIERGTRLMQVVGLAGGFMDTADTSKITVTRGNTPQPMICNLQAYISGNDSASNVLLEDGDVITVPERTPSIGTVFVYGAVKTPGQPITIREGMRVSQAISAAGGVMPGQADPNRCTLKRGGQATPIEVDMGKALAGDATADVLLNDGDIITIPSQEQNGTYTVYGAVVNAGEFPLKTNTTLSKALATAALTDRAKTTDVRVTRTDKSGKVQAMKVNVRSVSEGKTADVALQPGDTVYVPERSQKEGATRWLAVGISLVGLLIGL